MKTLKNKSVNSSFELIPYGWKKMNLGQIFEFKNGLNKGKEFFGKGTPIVNYVDVYNNREINGINLRGKVQVSKSEIERFSVQNGDVFFTRTSETIEEIGYSSVIINPKSDTVFSGFVLRAREINTILDDSFKKYCFSTYSTRKDIISKSSMTTRALTSGTSLSEVSILVPPIQEQKKIADILTTWEVAINKQTQILNEIYKYKNALISKVVSNKNNYETIPIIKLLKKDTANINELKKGYLEIGDVDITTKKYFITNKEPVSTAKKSKKGTILVSTVRPTRGAVTILDDNMLVSSGFTQIYIDEKIANPYFVYLQLLSEKFFNRMGKLSTGSTYPTVSNDDVLSHKIVYPNIEIQNFYAEIIKSIDKYIEKQQELLENYKIQKEGLIQQLLTGKIRVNTD